MPLDLRLLVETFFPLHDSVQAVLETAKAAAAEVTAKRPQTRKR